MDRNGDDRTALLLVDLQNDYFPGGAYPLAGAEEAEANAVLLLSAARGAGVPVVHVLHVSEYPGATFFLPGTAGAEARGSLAPARGEEVVVKRHVNSYRGTDLRERLERLGVRRLVIAGMQTHLCLESAVRASADLGYECVVAHDACATRDLAFGGVAVPAAHVHAAILDGLDGPFATVVPAREAAGILRG